MVPVEFDLSWEVGSVSGLSEEAESGFDLSQEVGFWSSPTWSQTRLLYAEKFGYYHLKIADISGTDISRIL